MFSLTTRAVSHNPPGETKTHAPMRLFCRSFAVSTIRDAISKNRQTHAGNNSYIGFVDNNNYDIHRYDLLESCCTLMSIHLHSPGSVDGTGGNLVLPQ